MAAWPALQHEVFSLISCICTYALVSPYNTPTYVLSRFLIIFFLLRLNFLYVFCVFQKQFEHEYLSLFKKKLRLLPMVRK